EMKTPNRTSSEPTHDEIALSAFLAWEKEGRPHGRDTIYWLNAEAQLRQLHQQRAEPVAPTGATAARSRTPVAPAREIKPALKATKASARRVSAKPATTTRTTSLRRSI